MYTEDDYKRGVENLREAGEIAKPFGVSVMLEFARTSRFTACLPTALKLVREANHPNVRVMMDTYHFWGGTSKFEDLELLRDGELHHLHFEDMPADPRGKYWDSRTGSSLAKGSCPCDASSRC